MKTRFDIELKLRIAVENGKDRTTKEEIMSMLSNGCAEISKGSFSHFVCEKKTGKILAEVEKIVLK